ncbi:uncharacterized protein CLUP02_02601 [Colletotrichum lupini]|uniref:Uncharacterized protein n=1 Tax=Colletotrichum lupini TaxID=145971 RepID=A0A9Q8SGT7_9PEZI|nr:uncharacterized protein CLUP02_02601 [Colletotrichum lupini]UQC77134.1 hypothetical protein CLUP02_02601 [Colletotrichum lupini]
MRLRGEPESARIIRPPGRARGNFPRCPGWAPGAYLSMALGRLA